jgi:hypothetical protein
MTNNKEEFDKIRSLKSDRFRFKEEDVKESNECNIIFGTYNIKDGNGEDLWVKVSISYRPQWRDLKTEKIGILNVIKD